MYIENNYPTSAGRSSKRARNKLAARQQTQDKVNKNIISSSNNTTETVNKDLDIKRSNKSIDNTTVLLQ